MTDTTDTDPTPTIYVVLPKCTRCGSSHLKAYKSRPMENDGSRVRYSKCVSCGQKLILVCE